MRTRSPLGLVLGISLAAVLAACGGGGATASPAPASPAPTAAPADTASPEAPMTEAPMTEAPAAGGETVTVADSGLGQILVDTEGMTLYLFENDTDGESVCYDDCAAAWPPLIVDGEITVGGGLDAAQFSTVERTDGTLQARIGNWPLYYWAADAAPGDTMGQGVGDVWFVVSPSGDAIK